MQSSHRRVRRGERGYALLALIIALIIMSVMMTVSVPDQRIQGKRESEIEMMFRGQQMAEAIARYYSAGKLTPAGLVVKSPPPPYGYLTELKKLRDGVLIGLDNVYFTRASAFIDPLTKGDWEPVRVGDPRLRKFFRAWQASTGRQIPPIYLSYLGSGAVVDTSEKPDDEEDGEVEEHPIGPAPNDDGDDADEGDEGDDEDEDYDEDEDDGDDEDDGEDPDEGAWRRTTDGTAIVTAALQTPPATNFNSNVARPQVQRPQAQGPKWVFGNDSTRTGPIIGVATRARGRSVRTWYGLDKYQDMIFIYIPMNLTVRTAVQPQQPSGQTPQQGGTDLNGDGIPDSVKPNDQQ